MFLAVPQTDFARLPAAAQVFSHVLRQAGQQQQQQDELLFTEADPKHFMTLTRTKDWRYVLINSHAKLSSEVSRCRGVVARNWASGLHCSI